VNQGPGVRAPPPYILSPRTRLPKFLEGGRVVAQGNCRRNVPGPAGDRVVLLIQLLRAGIDRDLVPGLPDDGAAGDDIVANYRTGQKAGRAGAASLGGSNGG